MSEVQEWIYIDAAGQQVGPIAADQLHEYVSAGHITADTQVWTEGMEAWLPASQVEGLIPPAAPQHVPQINLGPQTTGMATAAAAAPATQASPQASPHAAPAAAGIPQEGGEYPIPTVNRTSFGTYLTCLLGGLGLIFLGSMLLGVNAKAVAESESANVGSIAMPLILIVLGAIVLIVSSIIQFIAIYRVWAILQPGGGSVSPGQAIGFLFIPIFNSIWIIIILCKLPGEWNTIVSRYTNTVEAPRLSIGIAICAFLVPLIGQILWMNEISKAINFMSAAQFRTTNQQTPTQGGGIVLR